ncbi:hypothetical protein ABZP36_033978 [Zizania latifolia]
MRDLWALPQVRAWRGVRGVRQPPAGIHGGGGVQALRPDSTFPSEILKEFLFLGSYQQNHHPSMKYFAREKEKSIDELERRLENVTRKSGN